MTDHRQNVYEAHRAVALAEEARSQALAEALKAGETCRGLAELLDVSFNTVWRWAGIHQRARSVLAGVVSTREKDK